MTKTVPNIDTHALVAPHVARRQELQTEEKTLRDEHTTLSARWQKSKTDSASFDFPDPTLAKAREAAFGAAPKAEDISEQRLIELSARIKVLGSAIGLLESKIDSARGEASRQICEAARAEHAVIERTCAAKIAEATAAATSYHSFITSLEDAGVRTTSLEPHLPFFLQAVDRYGVVAQWLQGAVKRGTLRMKDIPERFDWTR